MHKVLTRKIILLNVLWILPFVIIFLHLIWSNVHAAKIKKQDHINDPSGIGVLSISSDGHYAISSHFNKKIVLWDLVTHTRKIVSNNGNVFSAYFIKKSPYYIWQSLASDDVENVGDTYVAVRADSGLSHDQLNDVKHAKKMILAKVGKNFYIYYSDPAAKHGYTKVDVSPKWWVNAEAQHAVKNNIGVIAADRPNINTIDQLKTGEDVIHSDDYLYVVDKSSPKGYKKIDVNYNKNPDDLIAGLAEVLLSNYSDVYTLKHSEKEALRKLAHEHGWNPQNIVHIQSLSGKEMLSFNNFPVYGQVMGNNLKTYFASDYLWNIASGYGENQKIIKPTDYWNTYAGAGKLLNFDLSANNKYLLTSGYPLGEEKKLLPSTNLSSLYGVVLWNVQTGSPVRNLVGNAGITFAAMSPDNKYIVSGDEQPNTFIWNLQTDKKTALWSLYNGHFVITNKSKDTGKWVGKELLPKIPKDFISIADPDDGLPPLSVQNIKFIDSTHYLKFINSVPYAVLFSVDSPIAIKYFKLGLDPLPEIIDQSGYESLDTSPSAHILVISDEYGNVIEYKYNPKKMTLNKVAVIYLYNKAENEKRIAYVCKNVPLGDPNGRCYQMHNELYPTVAAAKKAKEAYDKKYSLL